MVFSIENQPIGVDFRGGIFLRLCTRWDVWYDGVCYIDMCRYR